MTERVRSGSHPSAMISFVVTEPIWRTLGHSHLLWFQGGRWLSISCHLLSVHSTLPSCREGGWETSAETPPDVPAFGTCVLGFTLGTTAVALQSTLTPGSFLSPASPVLPQTCIFTRSHLALLPAHICTCMGRGPGLRA